MSSDQGFIPLSVPCLSGREGEYVSECITTGWVSSVGPFVERFEKELATYCGAGHAVAATSGTAALHLALLALGIERDDEVLVSDLTFIAPVNTIRDVGAHPVLVDAESRHWQMDAALVEDFLRHQCRPENNGLVNRVSGRRVRAILCVHVLGHPADLDALRTLADEFGLGLIEDGAEALGASYREKRVGTFGDAGCFSFNGNKTFTTGGGGMLVTNNPRLAAHARYLSTQAKDDPVEYLHNEVGFNYRLTNILAAIGCAQLEQAAAFLDAKQRIAQVYQDAFADLPGVTPQEQAAGATSSHWLYSVRIDAAKTGYTARDLMKQLATKQIQSRPLWQPMHLTGAHRACRFLGQGISAALYEETLSLPSSVNLTPTDQGRVVDAVRSAKGR
jgi:perosamine synthetase